MSIADKLTQLTTIRGDIRSALTAKGVSASDHDFADFATDIGTIPAIVNSNSNNIKYLTIGTNTVAINAAYMVLIPQSSVGTNLTPFSQMQTDYRVVIRFKHTGGSNSNRGIFCSLDYGSGYKLIPSCLIGDSVTHYKFNYNDIDGVFDSPISTTDWRIFTMWYDAVNNHHTCCLYDGEGQFIEAKTISAPASTSSCAVGIGGWRGNSGDKIYGDFDLDCCAIFIDENLVWGNLPSEFANIGKVNIDYTDPTQFTPVEYIQGTGYQWIQTDYYMTPTSRVVCDMQFTSVTPQARVFNSQTTNSSYSTYSAYINGTNQWAYAHQDGTGNWVSTNVSANTNRHTFDFYVNHYYKIDDGSTFSTTFTNTTTHNSASVIKLLKNDDSSSDAIGRAKIYSVKCYDDGVLVRDYRPVYHTLTGIVGLFDYVTNKFETNAGTDTFLKGADV